jgi:hypothetical protein
MSLQLSGSKPRQLQYIGTGLRRDLRLLELDEALLAEIQLNGWVPRSCVIAAGGCGYRQAHQHACIPSVYILWSLHAAPQLQTLAVPLQPARAGKGSRSTAHPHTRSTHPRAHPKHRAANPNAAS